MDNKRTQNLDDRSKGGGGTNMNTLENTVDKITDKVKDAFTDNDSKNRK